MTILLAVVVGLVGLLAGALVNRAAGRFPWDAAPAARFAVRRPVLEVATAALFVLTGLRFGASWELPAFLVLAAAAVLLAVIDVQHRLLPNRVVVPALGIGAVLLLVAALADQRWGDLGRAGAAAAVLFAVFLVMALISPSALGMGDVKLAALLGLHLGWLGWSVLLVGATAGFVIQALVALVLLATRRIGLRGELPFGPAMVVGAVVAIGWSGTLPH